MTSVSPTSRGATGPEFIALVAMLMALNALAIDIILPALPQLGAALGVTSENDRQFVLGAYMLGMGIAQLAIGPLSDRFGRRMPLLVGIGIYAVAAGAAILSPSIETLLALRFVQGLGAASTRVIAMSAVRDRFGGRQMAEVMSLVFMVFMVIPVIAPTIGQLLLFIGPWQTIFLFMAGIAIAAGIWAYIRLPETLAPENRRPLTASAVLGGFRIVFTNRLAICYGFAGAFLFGALFAFITSSQQIYGELYALGEWFPLAFALQAGLMAVASYTNSRLVRTLGMRRLAHGSLLAFTALSVVMLVLTLVVHPPLWLFFVLMSGLMFLFGWCSSNMNALSMEPLGRVAGTAASVFGFIQTLGGAVFGTLIGYQYNGTLTPLALGFTLLAVVTLILVLIAENGRLFGVGKAYEDAAGGHTDAH